METIKLGAAVCGSFCTFDKAFAVFAEMRGAGFDLFPIMSGAAAKTDTRFGRAADHVRRFEETAGRRVICEPADAEPVGPRKMFDVLAIAPCTGNTLAKLAAGISDTAVTLACKSHLRNERPVVIAVSTNDALAAGLRNIGVLLNRRNIFFVPFGQDDPQNKPNSCAAHMTLLPDAVRAALERRQLQPILR